MGAHEGLVTVILDPCGIPSPLTGEGQGEGGTQPPPSVSLPLEESQRVLSTCRPGEGEPLVVEVVSDLDQFT
jgi:hypothetical protein